MRRVRERSPFSPQSHVIRETENVDFIYCIVLRTLYITNLLCSLVNYTSECQVKLRK